MTVGATRLPELEDAAHTMPFDQFGRYHMLREAVDACRAALGADRLTILDVGGYYQDDGVATLPITRFLPADEVTVLDVVPCDLPGYVQGDGTALHFHDNSYDLVVSADTLEHIPQDLRPQFWRELLRVARHGVILLAPFGSDATVHAEAILFEYIKTDLHAEHEQLKEHRDYGLPKLLQWTGFVEEQGYHVRAYPTGYLHAWLGMMLLKHVLMRVGAGPEAQHLVDGYYNHNFFGTERRNPAYRYLVVAEKTPGILSTVDAALQPTLMPDQEDVSAGWTTAIGPTLFGVAQRQIQANSEYQQTQIEHLREQVRERDQIIAAQREHTGNLEGIIAAQREHISSFQHINHEQHDHILNLQSINQQLQTHIGNLQTGIVELRNHIANLEHTVATREEQIGALHQQIAMREEQIGALHQQIEALHQQIDALHQQIDTHRQQVSYSERLLADQQQMLSSMQQHYQHMTQTREQALGQVTQLQAIVDDLTKRANWLENQSQEARKQLDAVLNGRVLRLLGSISGRK